MLLLVIVKQRKQRKKKEKKKNTLTKNRRRKQGRAVLAGTMCGSIGISFMPLVKRFHLYSLPSEKASNLMFWAAEDIRSASSL